MPVANGEDMDGTRGPVLPGILPSSFLQEERYHQVHPVLDDLPFLHDHLLFLDPGTSDVLQGFRCAVDPLGDASSKLFADAAVISTTFPT